MLQQLLRTFALTRWSWLALAVSALGLLLRVEHALTFDQVHRASDYNVHLEGVRWMQQHWQPFFHAQDVSYQVRSYPPLWYFLSALMLELTGSERALVLLSLLGFVIRQAVLLKVLHEVLPGRPLSRTIGLAIHALLPLAILVDGKVNPESLHSGIFTLALYTLWRAERQSQSPRGISLATAAWFGAFAGLALLAKITGGMLVGLSAALFGWHGVRWLRRSGIKAAWQKVALPACAAATTWCAVAGWWSVPNLERFGHPFPHVWSLEGAGSMPKLAEPPLYRRSLGWALPFEWEQYWRFPILRTPEDPRSNFWAVEVTGTWSDVYNRGFCRLPGGATTSKAWGGHQGFMSQRSDAFNVSYRCVEWLATLLHVGVWISGLSVACVAWCLWQFVRSRGARGSLALSAVPVLCTGAALWFSLAYPYDNIAVLNPRYLLSQVMPMSACLAVALAELESVALRRNMQAVPVRILLSIVAGAVAVVGLLVLYERFGP